MPKKKVGKKSILETDLAIGRVSLTQRAVFARNLALMLKAGLTIAEALSILADQSKGKLKKVILEVSQSVESGNSLGDSFARHPKVFEGIFINITRAGEEAGTLEGSLNDIASHLEKERDLVSKIKGAMLYPIVVLVAAFILGIALTFFVLPKITPLFEGLKIDLPLTTRLLIGLSDLINNYGGYILLGIVGVVILLSWFLKTKFMRPAIHWTTLKVPIISKIVKNTNISRFCRVLGTLLKSGINIDKALKITQSTLGNYYYKKAVEVTYERTVKGNEISEQLAKYPYLFPVVVTRMIKVGEKSGGLEENLFYLGDFFEKEVDDATKSLSIAIEPMLLIIIGIVVAFLALSIITPIYQITGNVRR